MGHSSGAYIAYEMALRLEQQGKQASLLVIIDNAAPYGDEPGIMEAFKSSDLYESLEALFICAWVVSLAYNKPLPFSMEDLAPLPTEERYGRVADYFKETGFLPMSATHEMVHTVLHMLANHSNADTKYHEKYTPLGGSEQRYSGQTVLFRCTEETHWPGYDIMSEVDTSPFSNWERFCSGPIEVIGVPNANHITLVSEPCVRTIGENLQPYWGQS